jgi:hypothetical protein
MSKSRKNNRANVRSVHRKNVIVTYSYNDEYEYWFAPIGPNNQAIKDIAEGENIDELHEDVTKILQTDKSFKGADITYSIDRLNTSKEKQAEIAVFFSLKNL